MQNITALLVRHEAESFRELKSALARLSLATRTVSGYGEACEALADPETPHLVFTDTTLRDGTWADIVARAANAPAAPSVIVVARVVDLHLYAEALEAGAFDYIVPPFDGPGFEHVVRCALGRALERRAAAERIPKHTGRQQTLSPSLDSTPLEAVASPRTR